MDVHTTAAGATPEGAADPAAVPYGRSWVNVLIDWVERLPGPPAVAYVVALIFALLLAALPSWMSGVPIADSIRGEEAVWAFTLAGSVWLIHYLDGVARAALGDFATMLDVDPATLSLLEYELTVVPARPALLLLAVSAVRTTEAFVFQASAERVSYLSAPALIIRWPFEVAIVGLILVLVYHTMRQLRLVARIHAMAPQINLFRVGPLYAFSRLTSRTAIGLVAMIIPLLLTLTFATSALDYLALLTPIGLILGTALLSFVWPLAGMHRRMDIEKKRLQAEAGERLEAVIADVHRTVDQRDFSGADGQNKTLTSLIAERELVNRLSTWPWQVGTAGAVISAVLLPIVLWLATRFLERIL
jgi:hypothetical protein